MSTCAAPAANHHRHSASTGEGQLRKEVVCAFIKMLPNSCISFTSIAQRLYRSPQPGICIFEIVIHNVVMKISRNVREVKLAQCIAHTSSDNIFSFCSTLPEAPFQSINGRRCNKDAKSSRTL
mmetsp:Transcript_240/g.489  ORF Transcript_240/g.489 Transcript_240/m.489 type:complete len:123 (-) Transcript_240:773-1141(-)